MTRVPPLVWGHGLTSSRALEDTAPVIDLRRVRDHATIVRYDAHGHGESSPLSEPSRGSWHELALDQLELIEFLGIEDVILGGASMGAGTALHAGLMLGARVRGLVLVIPPTAWDERAAQIANYEQMAGLVERDGVERLIAVLAAIPPPDPFVGDDEYRTRAAERLRSAEPTRLVANPRGAAHCDLPPVDELQTIEVPTLILAWTGDSSHPVSTATQLAAALPQCELVTSSSASELAGWTQSVIDFLGTIVA